LLGAAACLGLLLTAFAYFNDTEASTGNTFTVGTWAVDVDGEGNSAGHTFQQLYVSDNGTETWSVKNTGTVPAYVDLNISVAESGTGHLKNYLMVHLYPAGGTDIYGGALINGISGSYDLNLPLSAGESKAIYLDWYISDGYNHDDNDQVTITINFDIRLAP
jgi:predicted ribosomally synthesized peptide with SipW-like signal peptide